MGRSYVCWSSIAAFAIKKHGMVIQYSPASIKCHPLVKCSHPRSSYDACHVCLFSQLIIESQLNVNSTTEGLFSSIDAACHDINSECVLCYRCALPNFKELAYQFRREGEASISRVWFFHNCNDYMQAGLGDSEFGYELNKTRTNLKSRYPSAKRIHKWKHDEN